MAKISKGSVRAAAHPNDKKRRNGILIMEGTSAFDLFKQNI